MQEPRKLSTMDNVGFVYQVQINGYDRCQGTRTDILLSKSNTKHINTVPLEIPQDSTATILVHARFHSNGDNRQPVKTALIVGTNSRIATNRRHLDTMRSNEGYLEQFNSPALHVVESNSGQKCKFFSLA